MRCWARIAHFTLTLGLLAGAACSDGTGTKSLPNGGSFADVKADRLRTPALISIERGHRRPRVLADK